MGGIMNNITTNYILGKMNELKADGVDFVQFDACLVRHDYSMCKIVASYTKEEWSQGDCAYPKTPYLLWKRVNGKKEYCKE